MSGELKFWGIDWAKGQWLCIGLGEGGGYCYFVAQNIGEVYKGLRERKAEIALIDAQIGLADSGIWRQCDLEAKKMLGVMKNSVFPTPCRGAIEKYHATGSKKEAERIQKEKSEGKNLSPMGWGIFPRVAEVDSFLREDKDAQKLFREIHPEVCFRAFNGESLCHGKKTPRGVDERVDILLRKEYLPNAKKIFDSIHRYRVGDDDILDALAGALTAKFVGCGKYKTLPPDPFPDSRGLPMQMLYFANDKNNQTP